MVCAVCLYNLMVPSDTFMSHLDTHLGYSTGEFQALQLIVLLRRLVLWINHLPPVCWSTFWKSILNNSWAVGLIQWTVNLHYLIRIFTFVIVYVLIRHTIFGFIFTYSIVFFIIIKYSCTNIFHRRSLYTFYGVRL